MSNIITKIGDSRLFNLFLGGIYALCYEYVFVHYIGSVYSYLNASYHLMSEDHLFIYVLLAAFPLVFYRGLNSIASAFSLFVYVFAYIPIVNAILSGGFPSTIIIKYSIVFFLAMCLFFLTDRLYLLGRVQTSTKRKVSFKYLELLTFILLSFFLISQRGKIHFVNFLTDNSLMYELRALNSMSGNYLLAWLRSAFLPLLLVCYLQSKSYLKYSLIFLGYLLIYTIDMNKITAISPFLVTGLFFVIKYYRTQIQSSFHLLLFSFVIIVPFILMSKLDNPTIFAIASIFIMRTLCMEGLALNSYIHFFEIDHHPFTYYNHINIVNAVTNANPYHQAIGYVVTGDQGNANAVFWLMDGVAAMGVNGVLIISLFFIIVKSIMNTLDSNVNYLLCICVLLFGIESMINVSLFTALNSCGFIILYFIILFFDLPSLTSTD